MALVLELLDLLADLARLLLRIPDAGDGRLGAVLAVGEQRLAEPSLVLGDEPGGGGQDVPRRAVVALEPDHRGAGEILVEAQDVVDLGAAPAVDRLVVVADAADVVAAALAVRLGQQPQPHVLDRVGVLVLVDQHEAEAALVLLQDVRVLAEQPDAFEQQVAEIGGVQDLQPVLVLLVALAPLAVGEGHGLARRHVLGRHPAVLPGVDLVGEAARGPALVVDVLRLDHLLQQADLVVGVEDGEAGLEADQLGMAAQDLGRDRVKRAEPRHALGDRPGEQRHALLHLARRLVGEGDGEDLPGLGAAGGDDVGDARRQHARLAGAGAGQHQHGPVERLDRLALLRVQPVEIADRAMLGAGTVGDAAGARRRIGQVFVGARGGARRRHGALLPGTKCESSTECGALDRRCHPEASAARLGGLCRQSGLRPLCRGCRPDRRSITSTEGRRSPAEQATATTSRGWASCLPSAAVAANGSSAARPGSRRRCP